MTTGLVTLGIHDTDRPAMLILWRLLETRVPQRVGRVKITPHMFEATRPTPNTGLEPIDLNFFIRKLRLEPCWCNGTECVVLFPFADERFEGIVLVRYVDQSSNVDVEFLPRRTGWSQRARGWLAKAGWPGRGKSALRILGSVSKRSTLPITLHNDMEVGKHETTRAHG
jgi:hypothetical protein